MKNNYKDEVVKIITSYLPKAKIILFGSRAKRIEQEGSDIDIALDTGTLIPHSILSEIKHALEESNIPVLVDIVDLQAAEQPLKTDIVHHGVLWKQ